MMTNTIRNGDDQLDQVLAQFGVALAEEFDLLVGGHVRHLQMTYMPPNEEIKLLGERHPELSKNLVELIVTIADRIRHHQELTVGLSVRATEEACIYLKHPLMEKEQHALLPEVLKSSFCGRFSGRWDDVSSDAGTAWATIQDVLREQKKK